MDSGTTFDQMPAIKALQEHHDTKLSQVHLKDLLADKERNAALSHLNADGQFVLDFTHTKLDAEAFKLLGQVASEAKVFDKIKAMFAGEKINNTEGRSVLHTALRKP